MQYPTLCLAVASPTLPPKPKALADSYMSNVTFDQPCRPAAIVAGGPATTTPSHTRRRWGRGHTVTSSCQPPPAMEGAPFSSTLGALVMKRLPALLASGLATDALVVLPDGKSTQVGGQGDSAARRGAHGGRGSPAACMWARHQRACSAQRGA